MIPDASEKWPISPSGNCSAGSALRQGNNRIDHKREWFDHKREWFDHHKSCETHKDNIRNTKWHKTRSVKHVGYHSGSPLDLPAEKEVVSLLRPAQEYSKKVAFVLAVSSSCLCLDLPVWPWLWLWSAGQGWSWWNWQENHFVCVAGKSQGTGTYNASFCPSLLAVLAVVCFSWWGLGFA